MKYIWLCVLCLAIMAAFIYYEHKEKYVVAVILKGLASLFFVVLGILSNIQTLDMHLAKFVKIGLFLGLIADVMLNLRFVFKKNGKIVFLVGILIFLAGHIMYIVAMLPNLLNVALAIIAGVVLAAVLLIWIFSKIEAQKAFKIFGIFYIGAISIMNTCAFKLVLEAATPGRIMFLIGAISFLISDVVLILNTFGKQTKFSLRITNLSFYYIGQLLIALSLQLL